ncbi:Protein of unknown function, putative, partial [Plasmodium vivax]
QSNFGNFIGKKNSDVKILDLVLHRSLSKYGFKEEPERRKLKGRLTYDRDMKRAKTDWDEMYTYNMLKKGEFSQLELYKKNYKKRYNQKKGLKKLDCYWEKKIFDKIEHVNILSEKTESRKKSFIKIILNEYTLFFLFLLTFIPFLGRIIPAMFFDKKPKDRVWRMIIGDCTKKKDDGSNECKGGFYHIPLDSWKAMIYLNEIISSTLLIVVISIFIYTCIKVLKYKLLKEGIRNITLKEYFRLLKN